MKTLIAEAVEAYSQCFETGKWDYDLNQKCDAAWAELKKPFAHFFTNTHRGYDDVGPGWWQPLLTAFAEIDDVLKQHPGYGLEVQQIKEKFGNIRFYYRVSSPLDNPDSWPRVEDPIRDEVGSKLRPIMSRLDSATAVRCEVCGTPAKSRSNGWIKTLCDHHDAAQRKLMRRRSDD